MCETCGRPWSEHYSEVDDSISIGWFGPVPAHQPPRTWIVCPFVEDEDV